MANTLWIAGDAPETQPPYHNDNQIDYRIRPVAFSPRERRAERWNVVPLSVIRNSVMDPQTAPPPHNFLTYPKFRTRKTRTFHYPHRSRDLNFVYYFVFICSTKQQLFYRASAYWTYARYWYKKLCPSVRPSVNVLYRNGLTHRHNFFTAR